jgi:azurin
MTNRWNLLALALITSLTSAACKESQAEAKPSAESATPAPAAVPPPPAPKPEPEAEKPARLVEIASKGNLLEFDLRKLTVKEGERVRLVFHNKSTLEVMPHNWVLIRPGTADKVGTAGQEKGEAGDYVDPTADVLAYTPMAKHGETVEITFTAPAAGTYEYICTVMGHWLSMKGELVVEK